ncbi:von Willebrand factor A domain-containing protein 3A-like [Branchiostoma floridae x Branchiostoma belcheri]
MATEESETSSLAEEEISSDEAETIRRLHDASSQPDETFITESRKRPEWRDIDIPPAPYPLSNDMFITKVEHTKNLLRAKDVEAGFGEGQSSEEWLINHSIEHEGLTIKDVLNKGKVTQPKAKMSSEKPMKHVQFEATDINEFEYKLNLAIEQYHKRIKWLLQGTKRHFGLVKGTKVAVLIDTSDANCAFGRINAFKDEIVHLIDEQLSVKDGLYFMSFGTDVQPLWDNVRDVNVRTLQEAREWMARREGTGGCNLLRALKKVLTIKKVNYLLIILGNCPDQTTEILCNYVEQCMVGRALPIHTVAYDCSNHMTNVTLRTLAERSGGRYHCYASGCTEQIYTGTDISILLRESKRAQDVIAKIKEMRTGMMGDALISIMNEISYEVEKLPQSRFLPRPPNHSGPLNIETPNFQPKTSEVWLKTNGLKGKKLNLYQVLSPNAFSPIEEFIPVIKKVVTSQVHEKSMAQFQWHDGTVKNVHVDPTMLYDYQKRLGAIVKTYERRVDWLSSGSRRIWGTVCENRVVILVDLSIMNANYLIHIQHSLRLLLEEQMGNKAYFNIVAFGSVMKSWKKSLQPPTPENLQSAWKWVLNLECGGSRNFLEGYKYAVENDLDEKFHTAAQGVYLFTSGVPDQQEDVVCSYIAETCGGNDLKLHCMLFSADDNITSGSMPGRYANINKTAEALKNMAHTGRGRFHWFNESGIIESDDITAVLNERDRAVNYSQKCAMLVDSVKRRAEERRAIKYQQALAIENGQQDKKMLNKRPKSAEKKALIPPKPTQLFLARKQLLENRDSDSSDKQKPWRPQSAKATIPGVSSSHAGCLGEKVPPSKKSGRPATQVFYTEVGNDVGVVFRQYPKDRSVRKHIRQPIIPDMEEIITTKQWLKKYSLLKLGLDLHKLCAGPDCTHEKRKVGTLHRRVAAKYCSIFPSVEIKGVVKHLQLLPHELEEYETQVERLLKRYVSRLQWLLSGSRRVFGVITEKKVAILVDTSGSMGPHLPELKKELASLVWDQICLNTEKFNLIRFSSDVDTWQVQLVEPTDEFCHDAVQWQATFVAEGNTNTLGALEEAFQDSGVDGVYLLTDGKPDQSASMVLKEVAKMNEGRGVHVNTISFNCDDSTANSFLKQLASETGGRYHRCHGDYDGHMFAHRLLTSEFQDEDDPNIPPFEGDDLRRLGAEIMKARQYLTESRQWRSLHSQTSKPHQKQYSKTSPELLDAGKVPNGTSTRPLSASAAFR